MKHINEGYCGINSFFDAYGLPFAALRLTSFIKAADSRKIWKGGGKSCPSDLVLFAEKIEGLLEAGFQLASDKKVNEKAILNKDSELILTNYDFYLSSYYIDNNPRHALPRHLDSEEFINPYSVLHKVVESYTEKEWKACLNNILHHALSPFNIYESSGIPMLSLLRIYILLHKFIEACYLIDMRIMKKVKAKKVTK